MFYVKYYELLYNIICRFDYISYNTIDKIIKQKKIFSYIKIPFIDIYVKQLYFLE